MIGRATLTPPELDGLLDAPGGTALGIVGEHGLPFFQLDPGSQKLIGWRSAVTVISLWFADRPAEIEQRLVDLDRLRGGGARLAITEGEVAVLRHRQEFTGGAAAIELLQRAVAEVQSGRGWLTQRLFDGWAAKNAPGVTAAQIRSRFRGWVPALHAAGLRAPDIHNRLPDREQRKQAMVADIRKAAAETMGSPLLASTYDRWAIENGAARYDVIRSLSGWCWASALIAAGLPTRRLRWHGTPSEMLDALRCAAADLGSDQLTVDTYTTWLKTHEGPSAYQLRRQFGAWREAVLKAGHESGTDRRQLPMLLPIELQTGA